MGKSTEPPVVSTNTESHHMRITSAGSIASYVRFALSFLQANPNRALVLHTLPLPSASTKPSSEASTSSSTLTPSLLTAPRLVSVVEIIKREYISKLDGSECRKGKHTATGIWQYTETGLLPDRHPTRDEQSLTRVLEGKTK
ncbi:MAG: hypothetical protein TREMPRED_001014 [Tremellales sp. Tagirdzhanova-0007]|nr:MAG: hypothetical protein TREMPRED_001014 [Tremellales sp. Tagirdzhanova-0007]